VETVARDGRISDRSPSAFVAGSEEYFDGVIAVTARIDAGDDARGDRPGTPGVSIVVGCRHAASGPGRADAYRLAVRPDARQFRLHRSDGEGGTRELLPQAWVDSPAIRPGTEGNTLYLRCIGTEIVARINGRTVASVRDGADGYRPGRLFIGMGEPPAQGRVLFDDLVVTVYR
jgi:hypothetical protein